MATRPILDLDLLRTLLLLAEEANFTKTAKRVGRTQSAVTLQVQRLESLVQKPLVIRSKVGPVEFTPEGKALLEKARAMLALNDEMFKEIAAPDLPATIRLGVSSTYNPFYLARALEHLRARRPTLLVELTEGYSCQVSPQIKDGGFDLVVCEGGHEPRGWPATEIWRGPLKWITSIEGAPHRLDPLPLSLPPGQCPWRPAWMDDCYWRSAALRTLERNGVAHRIVASSTSMDGLYVPVRAGKAVTITHGGNVPPGVRILGDDEGLPRLPDGRVVLLKSRSAPQPLTDFVAETIRSHFVLE